MNMYVGTMTLILLLENAIYTFCRVYRNSSTLKVIDCIPMTSVQGVSVTWNATKTHIKKTHTTK